MEAIAGQQYLVAWLQIPGFADRRIKVGLGTNCMRDEIALRRDLGLCFGHETSADLFSDKRVIFREPEELSVTKKVGAGVAGVDHL